MKRFDLRKLAIQNRVDELRAAIAEGADPNEKDGLGSTALLAAIAYRSLDAIPVLLDGGADVTVQDKDGSTALHYAIEHKLPKVLKVLLEKCPDAVSIADKHGNQPLWAASFNARGDYEMVTLLLKYGADPEHINNVALTPLDIPKRKGEPELLQLLESKINRK